MSNKIKQCTACEENFAQFYALEGRASPAYRHAYSTANCVAATVASNAQQVLNRVHVQLRIFELQSLKDDAFKITARKKKMFLLKIIETQLQTVGEEDDQIIRGDLKAAISAISELNKMDGHLAASKKEITGKDGSPIETRSMTSEEYKATRDDMLKTDDC